MAALRRQMTGRLRVRDLFSIVAFLLVAVLCAALAVPYFVNWESRRAEVEAALGQAFGIEIRTEGPITVRLLPTPRLELERVFVGGETPVLTAAGLDVALDAPPLLGGRIEVTSARLQRPELRIIVGEQGGVRLPAAIGPTLTDAGAVGIASLEIDQGTIRVTHDSAGGPVEQVIGPFDASANAPSLAGPWRIELRDGGDTLSAATGAVGADGRLRLKVRASVADTGGQAEFDGYLLPQEKPSISGRFNMSLPLPASVQAGDEAADHPRLTASADVTSEGWALTGSNVEIRSGAGASAAVFTGSGSLDAGLLLQGETPPLVLTLDSRRVDVRPLIAAWGDGGSGLGGAVSRFLQTVPLKAALTAGSLAYAGEELGAASADILTQSPPGQNAPAGVRLEIPRFDVALPGGGKLDVADAVFAPGGGFSGKVDFKAGDGVRLANALKNAVGNAQSLDELGLMLRLSQTLRDWPGLSVRGDIAASASGIAVRNLDASAEGSTLAGDLQFTPAVGDARARADATLVLQGVDLESLPRLDPMVAVRSGVDLTVDLQARRLRFGTAPASEGRQIAARFSTTADGVTVEQFDLIDPDGARLSASGHLGEDGGRIVAAMEAADPGPFLALYRPFLPAAWGDALTRAAPVLGPLKLDATIARPGAGSPLVAVITGSAAQTAIDGRIVSDPAGAAGDRAVVDVRLESPDAPALLGQLGLVAMGRGDTASPSSATGKFVVAARGNGFNHMDGRASLTAGGSKLVLDGSWRGSAEGVALTGPMQLETPDAGALAALLGRPLPVTEAPVPASLTGALRWQPGKLAIESVHGSVSGNPLTGALVADDQGVRGDIALQTLDLGSVLALALGPGARPQEGQLWSSRRLGGSAPAFTAAFGLKAKRLAVTPGLALTDASLQADISPEVTTLTIAESAVDGGGQAAGTVSLRRLGAQVNVRGDVALRQVALAALTNQQIAGTASGKLEFGASAETVAGLVSTVAGGGEVRIADATIPDFNPEALQSTVAGLLDSAAVEMDPSQVAARLGAELDAQAWPVPDLTVPLTLASGTLRFGPLTLEAEQTRAGISGGFGLGGLTLDARAHLYGLASPAGWSGAAPQAIVVWRGTLPDLQRQVEAGSVANGLAAIALTRELDRIERLEAEAKDRIEKARREREERARKEAERLEAERLQAERLEAERVETERLEAERLAIEKLERERQERERQRLEELAREAAEGRAMPAPQQVPSLPAPLDIRPDAGSP
ncbi:AsmA family protein [Pseudochelatococcus contaminans]|uniref:AsmA domain-containing protein n=1 Tax=Pseudochelatococcus contaminans TaxID=1538103 RepID=A0A7W5Z495_9HYPH|nr:AsmA family protein [Pseudochelatococcus contaminans]MBB3809832.1 hypothetical protein [Pseudochelatococcus contaminans]